MEIRGGVTRRDERRTTNKQWKIELLSLWAVGRLSFANIAVHLDIARLGGGVSNRVPHKIQSENFETGHLFSIAKLNFESICFLAFFDLRPFKLVHRHLKFLAFLHSENEVKICKIDKMAKNHFSRAEKGSQGV